MDKPTVTLDQAMAFVEALTGQEGMNNEGDPSGRDRSPAALAHLRAALGMTGTAYMLTVARATNGMPPQTDYDRSCIAKTQALAAFLRGVAEALAPLPTAEPPPQPIQPPPAGEDDLEAAVREIQAFNNGEYAYVERNVSRFGTGEFKEEFQVYTESRIREAPTLPEAVAALRAALPPPAPEATPNPTEPVATPPDAKPQEEVPF